MDIEEARKVAYVLADSDGGCPVCVERAVEGIQKQLPQFDWATLVDETEWKWDEEDS